MTFDVFMAVCCLLGAAASWALYRRFSWNVKLKYKEQTLPGRRLRQQRKEQQSAPVYRHRAKAL